jgi:hypothetical protein
MMKVKGEGVSQKGLYQAKIADAHIRTLYRIAKRQGVKMTTLLNLIVATAIEELDNAANLCDEPSATPIVAQSAQGRVLQGRPAPHAHAVGPATKNHDRRPVRHVPYVRQRHQRKKV